MTPSNDLYAVTKFFEGLSSKPYVDSAGYETVGIGHKILAGENFSQGITLQEAEQLLRDDMGDAVVDVQRLVTVPLTQGQFDCLCDFTYNLGGGKLKESTLLKRLNAGDYAGVPYELYHVDKDCSQHGWIFAGGKIMAGLVKRRQAEIALWNDEVPQL